MFQLQPKISELKGWSLKYVYDKKNLEQEIITSIAPKAKQNGFLDKKDFLKVCEWKTDRSKSRCDKNTDDNIREITSIAFSTPNERLRIESLTLLDGVKWPTASVFLHFFHSEKYPILDIRALFTLGIDLTKVKLQYNFNFWKEYVAECRRLSEKANLDMRTLDRALWSYRPL
jgi:hypothetical protein